MNGYFNNPYNFQNMNNIQNMNNMQQTQQNSNVSWIDVANINDINNISVQPGTTAWIRFINDPIIACKTSDSMGICTTKYFEIKEINLNQPQIQNTENFVTKEDFNNIINDLNTKFQNLTKQNNNTNNSNKNK